MRICFMRYSFHPRGFNVLTYVYELERSDHEFSPSGSLKIVTKVFELLADHFYSRQKFAAFNTSLTFVASLEGS